MAPWAALSGRLGLAENLPLRREPIFKRQSILAPSFTIELIGSFFDHAREVIAGRQRTHVRCLRCRSFGLLLGSRCVPVLCCRTNADGFHGGRCSPWIIWMTDSGAAHHSLQRMGRGRMADRFAAAFRESVPAASAWPPGPTYAGTWSIGRRKRSPALEWAGPSSDGSANSRACTLLLPG